MPARKGRNTTDEADDFGTQEIRDRVTEIGEQVQSEVADISRQVRTGLKRANINQTTIPDAFRRAPKIISPRVHAWLDVAVTGYFAVLGTIFAVRGKVGPAVAAFVNAGMVAGVSAFTEVTGYRLGDVAGFRQGQLLTLPAQALHDVTLTAHPLLKDCSDEEN